LWLEIYPLFFFHIFSWTKQVNSKCQYFSTLVWLLKRALFPTEFSVDIYTHIRKALVCDLWYVGNNFIEGFTDRHNTQKKKKLTRFIPPRSLSMNITYHRHNLFCPSVFFSVNFMYNRQIDHQLFHWWVNSGGGIWSNFFLIFWSIPIVLDHR